MAVTTTKDFSKWKHHQLDDSAREEFKRLVETTEAKYPLFLFLKWSSVTLLLWPMFICLLFIYASIKTISGEENIISILGWIGLGLFIGIMRLSINFVATHVSSHALFLHYDDHRYVFIPSFQGGGWKSMYISKTLRKINNHLPIYFYAFYHHHHSRVDNWLPEMSDHDGDGRNIFEHEGSRNIIAAHWHGYSVLSSIYGILTIFVVCYHYPWRIWNFLGYELGVLLLPLAHGWQHIPPQRFGKLRPVFEVLERWGVIAGKKDHTLHHVHTGPWVYQDFSSSGFHFMGKLDNFVNRFWQQKFDQATRTGKAPYELVYWPTTVVSVMSILAPIFF